jgi:hypothetical protein
LESANSEHFCACPGRLDFANRIPGPPVHGRTGYNLRIIGMRARRASIANADPPPNTGSIAIDNQSASHDAVTGICVGVLICVGAATKAECQSGSETPTKTTAPTAMPVATTAMTMLSVGSCRKCRSCSRDRDCCSQKAQCEVDYTPAPVAGLSCFI